MNPPEGSQFHLKAKTTFHVSDVSGVRPNRQALVEARSVMGSRLLITNRQLAKTAFIRTDVGVSLNILYVRTGLLAKLDSRRECQSFQYLGTTVHKHQPA
jgi:hypothetical protein